MGKISINPDALKAKREWKRHKVKEGNNSFRFLPPLGESAEGYPYRRWDIIWGLNDPKTGKMRPYASSSHSEKKCPVREYVDILYKRLDDKKAELKSKGLDDKSIKDQTKSLNKVVSNLRPKTVYVYNAVDKSGLLGLLEVKPSAHKELKEVMMGYITDYNQDPTSVNNDNDDSGVWININRTGQMFDTKYKVTKVQKQQKLENGQIVFVDDREPLPENIKENWEEVGYDLSTVYQNNTYDYLKKVLFHNIDRIKSECPEAIIDGFFDGTQKILTEEENTSEAQNNVATGSTATMTETPTANTEPTPVATTDNDDIMAMADELLNS